MEHISRGSGVTVSYQRYGHGPPLVLVHGGFSDHATNWQEVKSALAERFTVYAVARRGRGQTTATHGHGVLDEAEDIAAVVRQAARESGKAVALLGHSYGGVCSLEAAHLAPDFIRRLVLYEPPYPGAIQPGQVATLEQLAAQRDWDALVQTFLIDVLQVPPDEVTALRNSPGWTMWITDAPASVHDLRALIGHQFDADAFKSISAPTLLLVGTESPRDLYLTDALLATLRDVRIVELAGQAHEAMTTAPDQFVTAISPFLLG